MMDSIDDWRLDSEAFFGFVFGTSITVLYWDLKEFCMRLKAFK